MYPVIIQVSNYGESIVQRSFRHIGDKTVIRFILDRLKTEYSNDIILATSDMPGDDVYESVASDSNVRIYRGSGPKCLTRLAGAMKLSDAEGFIRVYANYPLLDIDDMKRMLRVHEEGEYEYSYNEHMSGLMIGTGCDIFSRGCVERMLSLGLKTSQEETVGFYVRQNDKEYKISRFINEDFSGTYNYKVSLDGEKDLELINDIARNVEFLSNESIGRYLDDHPTLAVYNSEKTDEDVDIDKFFFHPAKLASVLQEEFDKTYPICADISLIDRQKTELSEKALFKLLDELSLGGTKAVTIVGDVEQTEYPFFSESVNHVRDCGLEIGLVTDGIVRLDNDIVEKFEWIRVDLNATTVEEYKKMNESDHFETILNNIFHYTHHCGMVGVGFEVMSENISYLEELVMRLRDLGVSYIKFHSADRDCEHLPVRPDLSYLKLFENISFRVIINDVNEEGTMGNYGLPCCVSGVNAVVSADGSVFLCKGLKMYKWTRPIGNINEQSFHDIWLGRERKIQYELVGSDNFCSVNCPKCNLSKMNLAIDRMKNVRSKNFI